MAVNLNDNKSNSKGFTIVELLIATTVFSFVLLLCATAIVQIGRMFYKSTIINRTQTTTRTVIDDVSQSIQFSEANTASYIEATPITPSPGVTVNAYCLGSVRYSFAQPGLSVGSGVGRIAHVLWKDRITGVCTPANLTQDDPNGPVEPGQELLGNSMRLSRFRIIEPTIGGVPNPSGIWRLEVTVAYGATTDLFEPASNFQTCVGSGIGGQFCGVSAITTNVIKRL